MFNNLSAPNTGFTREEGISHLHKKVRSLCNADFVSVEETKGKTVFVDERREGKYSVVIDWDYSIRGKHELIWYDKKEYEKCIVEMSEAEQ